MRGWVTHYVLFFLELADCRRHDTPGRCLDDSNRTQPHGPGRGVFPRTRFLIMDRDTKYSEAFRGIIAREGTQVIRLPRRSQNLNAFAERFVRSIKEKCIDRMIFFGRSSLERAFAQYISH